MRSLIAALVLAAAAGAVQAHEVKAGDLTLSDLQVRSAAQGLPTTAAYLTITNAGKTPDRLVAVECACAASAMMHETRTRNGISSMVMLKAVEVPAGGKAVFSPTGLHIMLVRLKGPLKAGTMQDLTLRFEKAGRVKAGFHVRDLIQAAGAESHAGMKH